MTTMEPTPEQYAEWYEVASDMARTGNNLPFLFGKAIRLAYQTGADDQLRLCVEWLKKEAMSRSWQTVSQLAGEMQSAMRPEPPSMKEQALEQLDEVIDYAAAVGKITIVVDDIRRALESLPD
jgi:hypothetical protein